MGGLMAKASAFWTMAAMGLAGLVAYQAADDQPASSKVIPVALDMLLDDQTADSGTSTLFLPEDLINEIVARPLFSPSRRPVPRAALQQQPADKVRDDEPLFELVGTMLIGKQHIALLKHPEEGLVRRRPGERIGDWQVTAVGDQRVSLESDGRKAYLSLRKDLAKPTVKRSLGKPKVKSQAEPSDKAPTPPETPARKRI